MSTNFAVGILENSKIKAIYGHWDGHIETAGKTLQQHYDVAKTKKLIALGSVSVLGDEIGVKQDFDSFDGRTNKTCLFYGRDRGEDDVAAKTFKTKEAMVKWFETPFFYLLDAKTGVWYASRGKTWFNLKNALGRK